MNKNILSRALTATTAAVIAFSVTSCATMSRIGLILSQDTDSTVASIGHSISSIEKAAEDISPENEYYIGRSVAAAVSSTYEVVHTAPKTTAYLNKICGTIAMNSDTPYLYKGYYVGIIDTDEINAMATPGGHIFVSRGLIKSVDSEDALAAVLAHEIAHIQLKHSITTIKSSRVTTAITSTTKASAMIAADKISADHPDVIDELRIDMEKVKQDAAVLFDSQEVILKTLVTSGFSKEQELEADTKALTLMRDAGYDPKAMLDMLNLIADNNTQGGWNKTHPSPKIRIKNVEKRLKKLEFEGTDKQVRQSRFTAETKDI